MYIIKHDPVSTISMVGGWNTSSLGPSRSHRELPLAPQLGSTMTFVKQASAFCCAWFNASEIIKCESENTPKM